MRCVAIDSIRLSCSIIFKLHSLDGVLKDHSSDKEFEPEGTVLSVIKVSVIVHWISRHCLLEANSIGAHIVLELYGIFLCDTIRVWVSILDSIVEKRRMKDTWSTPCWPSDWSTIGSWYTTFVETKIISIVFLSLLSKLCYSNISIRSTSSCLARRNTSLISLLAIKHHLKLLGCLFLVHMWILASWNVKSCSWFSYREYLICFDDIPKLFNIRISIASSIISSWADIWMVLLSERSISLLNLLWSGMRWNIKDFVVVLLESLLHVRGKKSSRNMHSADIDGVLRLWYKRLPLS